MNMFYMIKESVEKALRILFYACKSNKCLLLYIQTYVRRLEWIIIWQK